MNFKELQTFDSSLTIYKTNPADFKISGISHSDAPQANTFVFIKGARFHKVIGRRSEKDEFLDAGVVIEDKYFQSLTEEAKAKLKWFIESSIDLQEEAYIKCENPTIQKV